MAVNLDIVAAPLAGELLACLCAALEDTVGGPACVCSLYPGAEAPMDYCCKCDAGQGEGQAWVRVARIFPVGDRFPAPTADLQVCKRNEWAVELEIGVYRCMATLDSKGRPPSAEQLTADTEKILDDAAAMRRAIMCCWSGTQLARQTDWLQGEWRPIGPNGGCGGGAMTLTVRAVDCCPPVQ